MSIYDEMQADIAEALEELDQTSVYLRVYTSTEDADDPAEEVTPTLSQQITLKAAGDGFSPARQDKNTLIEEDQVMMVCSAQGLTVVPTIDHKIWDGSQEYAIEHVNRIPAFGPTAVAYELVIRK